MASPIQGREALTTGEAALYARVACKTVVTWCDQDRLPHYRLPGTAVRRILREDLRQFLRRNGMPVHAELDDAYVLGIGAAAPVVPGYTPVTADASVPTGVMIGARPPAALLLDVATIGRSDTARLVRAVRSVVAGPIVVVMTEDDTGVGFWRATGADAVVPADCLENVGPMVERLLRMQRKGDGDDGSRGDCQQPDGGGPVAVANGRVGAAAG